MALVRASCVQLMRFTRGVDLDRTKWALHLRTSSGNIGFVLSIHRAVYAIRLCAVGAAKLLRLQPHRRDRSPDKDPGPPSFALPSSEFPRTLLVGDPIPAVCSTKRRMVANYSP